MSDGSDTGPAVNARFPENIADQINEFSYYLIKLDDLKETLDTFNQEHLEQQTGLPTLHLRHLLSASLNKYKNLKRIQDPWRRQHQFYQWFAPFVRGGFVNPGVVVPIDYGLTTDLFRDLYEYISGEDIIDFQYDDEYDEW